VCPPTKSNTDHENTASSPLNKTEKYRQSIVIYHWQQGWSGPLNQSWRKGVEKSQTLGVGVGWRTSAESGSGWQTNLPEWDVTDCQLILWDCVWCTKLNWPTLSGEVLTSQNLSCGATQLPPGKNNNRSHQLAQTDSELSQTPIATCPVGRRNKLCL
jgi:hypothetical protein